VGWPGQVEPAAGRVDGGVGQQVAAAGHRLAAVWVGGPTRAQVGDDGRARPGAPWSVECAATSDRADWRGSIRVKLSTKASSGSTKSVTRAVAGVPYVGELGFKAAMLQARRLLLGRG
jgi:hypothetical protein